jgi:hypothetical protein
MSRVFDISCASEAVRLDGKGHGDIAFTVTNVSARAVRGRFKIKPLDAVGTEAFGIDGASERMFNPNDTQQVAVKIDIPPGTKEGKYRFRLDGINVDSPDEDFTEGPALVVDVKTSAAPKRKFPWWILVVIALVLAVGGAVAYMIMNKNADTVELPVVTGVPYNQARAQLSSLGLVVSHRPQATASAPADTVIAQSPPATQQVKKGSEVALTVAAAPVVVPETVELPRVIGMPFGDAKTRLTALGLVVNRHTQTSDSAPAESVIAQAPSATQKVAKGSEVALTVAVAQPAAPANPFVGTWTNQDRNTRYITRLIIQQSGGAYKVQAFGSCSPTDCDWGAVDATAVGDGLDATWDQGFAVRRLAFRREGAELKVSADNIYRDGRGLTRSMETFVRPIVISPVLRHRPEVVREPLRSIEIERK